MAEVEPPVIDPTENVLQLVEAANKRQDDLREMEAKHTRELNAMRDAHAKELRQAEAARIDAIRAVDVAAVQTANLAAEARATTLSNQVALTADAFQVRLSSVVDPIQKDIADLRRSQYEAQGGKAQDVEHRGVSQWAVGFALSAALAIMSAVSFVLYVASH